MTWKKKWGYEVQPTTTPGVLRIRDGRFLVHAKLGRKKRLMRVSTAPTPRAASADRLAMIAEAKRGPTSSRPLFAAYATSLFKRKVDQGDLGSQKTIERWEDTLTLHLVPAFGASAVDELTKLEIEAWKSKVAKRIKAGKLSPHTANGWLRILRQIVREAVDDYQLEKDPSLRVRDFKVDEHPTYTEEEPNALTLPQAVAFLAAMRKKFPQFYAVCLLGFVTGLRPSSLRPLRRRGATSDVLWEERAILVRRSNALAQHVRDTTKTGLRYKLGLPGEVIAELRVHVGHLRGKRKASSLLFPSKRGGCMSRSALDKPFAAVSRAIGLTFTFTPRGMRRTYQDLARGAGVPKEIRKAVCGHETDQMAEHYSTISLDEMRAAVGSIARAVTRAA